MTETFILGIDGGGTSTVAWIARRDDPRDVIGRGVGGPSNPQAVGIETAIENLEAAIDTAIHDASLSPTKFAAACLGMAGIDREVDRKQIERWSVERELTDRLQVVNDALPLLYAANTDGVGIALISGTGTLAFGRSASGATARAGGWGYLFGDEGSAYRIAVEGLRAAAQSADGRGTETLLLENFLCEFECEDPQQLITAIYAPDMTRRKIAALSNVVFDAYDSGDGIAQRIIEDSIDGLAQQVIAVAERLEFADAGYSLAMTGGVLLNRAEFQSGLKAKLTDAGRSPVTLIPVPHPVAGALVLASRC